jgi:hypothetical protein
MNDYRSSLAMSHGPKIGPFSDVRGMMQPVPFTPLPRQHVEPRNRLTGSWPAAVVRFELNLGETSFPDRH